ncbi:MAG: 16S rRNA (adenine(1518)-N(6)/adenine(1519)-N(6))-dimethyltransferase RsmA [Verrucomicrobiota bacterium]|nr:16S rRNA (adenine(1518)-N(6)/adenine(1519)-N(6))-dimethyltransferase RsmA [Verrucomicrobiota bacterium]
MIMEPSLPKIKPNYDLKEFLTGFNSDSEVVSILNKIGVRPSKGLGQNFLIDGSIAESIVNTLRISPEDTVIEIGPGLGALTRHLIGNVRRLVLVEFDRKIYEYLSDVLSELDGVEVLHEDAVKFDIRPFYVEGGIKIVGNLPYSCGTEIIRNFLDLPTPVDLAVFMLQKEVVDRFCAIPRTKSYGFLTVMIRSTWNVEKLQELSFEPFTPRPEVNSAVIRFSPCDYDTYPPFNKRVLKRVVKCGFQERRKQLKKRLPLGNFTWVEICEELNLKETARAEELTVDEWIKIARLIDDNPLKDNPQSGDEMFDVVDEDDQVTGQMKRSRVHSENLMHRAVHVFIFNKFGDLFLQKRSRLKDSSPGLWDSSASGHLNVAETYHDAAVREVFEELGISRDVDFISIIEASENTGWEFVHLYSCEHDGPFNFPYSEIEGGKFFPMTVIRNWTQERPEDFASGFIECLCNYVE